MVILISIYTFEKSSKDGAYSDRNLRDEAHMTVRLRWAISKATIVEDCHGLLFVPAITIMAILVSLVHTVGTLVRCL